MYTSRLALAFIILLIISGCKTGINPPDPPKPGKRDYVWTIDTLSYPGSAQTLMRDIWASSASDVYVVGYDQVYGQMYHYNGSTWTSVKLAISQGGQIEPGFELNHIFGFNSNDIWVIGDRLRANALPPPDFIFKGLIIHYDGSVWREVPINHNSIMAAIWGSAPNDVWFSAVDGALFHYDGIQISRVQFDSSISVNTMHGISPNSLYAMGIRDVDTVEPEDTAQYVSLHYDGVQWKQLDSFLVYPGFIDDKFGIYDLWGVSDQEMFSVGRYLFLWNGVSWQTVRYTIIPYFKINGTRSNHVFAVGDANIIDHFNGSDWYRYREFLDQQKYAISVWCDESEVFVVSAGYGKTFIEHGQ